MRCCVTGASGHLGAALTRSLLAAGQEVIAVVRPSSDLWRLAGVENDVEVVRAVLAERERLAGCLCNLKIDAVLHAAWGGVTAGDRNAAAQIPDNVTDALSVVQAAADAGCGVFVGVGSQAEFGPYDVPLSEALPVRPQTAYGAAKLAAGLLTAKIAKSAGIRHSWLRLIATYGPMDDERHLISAVTLQLLRGETPRLSPGGQLCDYLYVDDAADALRSVVETADASGVFVLGSGQVHSVRDLCSRLRDLVDPSAPMEFGAVPYRPDQVMCMQANISRLHESTGWSPVVGIDEGLERTVDYYRDRERSS